MKITRIETIPIRVPIKPELAIRGARGLSHSVSPFLLVKIHTDAGVYGLGEPLLEGRALTVQTAIKEIEPYLIGKDPRHIIQHWQAIYRGRRRNGHQALHGDNALPRGRSVDTAVFIPGVEEQGRHDHDRH